MATPITSMKATPATVGHKAPDRRLRLEDILKLMVSDGLVGSAEADNLARSRTRQCEHPLERLPSRAGSRPRRRTSAARSNGWSSGWPASSACRYMHIDPLKIDLAAVTQTMSNAYAERYRILPVAVNRDELTVATAEPFVRAWADELEQMLKLRRRSSSSPIRSTSSATWASSTTSRGR